MGYFFESVRNLCVRFSPFCTFASLLAPLCRCLVLFQKWRKGKQLRTCPRVICSRRLFFSLSILVFFFWRSTLLVLAPYISDAAVHFASPPPPPPPPKRYHGTCPEFNLPRDWRDPCLYVNGSFPDRPPYESVTHSDVQVGNVIMSTCCESGVAQVVDSFREACMHAVRAPHPILSDECHLYFIVCYFKHRDILARTHAIAVHFSIACTTSFGSPFLGDKHDTSPAVRLCHVWQARAFECCDATSEKPGWNCNQSRLGESSCGRTPVRVIPAALSISHAL